MKPPDEDNLLLNKLSRCASASTAKDFSEASFCCGMTQRKDVFLMRIFSTKQLVTMALMLAMEVVLTRFLSINTPMIRIGFGFLPIAVVAVMYGPIRAALVGALADFIGANMFGTGAYFPGFTLTGFLIGATYGVFMYKRPSKMFNIVASVLIVTIAWQLALDTLWVHIITGTPYVALLPWRIARTVAMIPVQIFSIKAIFHVLEKNPSLRG